MVRLTQRVSCQSRVEATCRDLLRVRARPPGRACRAPLAAAPVRARRGAARLTSGRPARAAAGGHDQPGSPAAFGSVMRAHAVTQALRGLLVCRQRALGCARCAPRLCRRV